MKYHRIREEQALERNFWLIQDSNKISLIMKACEVKIQYYSMLSEFASIADP